MIKTLIYAFFLILASIGLSACHLLGWCKDDSLSSPRIDYTGSRLKLNGYYYIGNYSTNKEANVPIAYLYRNGIFANKYITQTQFLSNVILNTPLNQSRWDWSIFKIEGNKITIEGWLPTMCGAQTFFDEGEILNDTTFVIKSSERREKGRVRGKVEQNSIYHFRQSNIKPDSTNSFIK